MNRNSTVARRDLDDWSEDPEGVAFKEDHNAQSYVGSEIPHQKKRTLSSRDQILKTTLVVASGCLMLGLVAGVIVSFT